MAINKSDYLDESGNYNLTKTLITALIDGNVDIGSDANATWVKFPNGLMIQFGLYYNASLSHIIEYGTLFRNMSSDAIVSLSVPFINSDFVLLGEIGGKTLDAPVNGVSVIKTMAYATNQIRFYISSPVSGTSSVGVHWLAVGMWR